MLVAECISGAFLGDFSGAFLMLLNWRPGDSLSDRDSALHLCHSARDEFR